MNNSLTENKKKKERRKEKDATAIETSDEEANNVQGRWLCLPHYLAFLFQYLLNQTTILKVVLKFNR